jgi:glycosyltransferase involved in cell wall biosynthesis
LGVVALLSADPWDDVWRRNQCLASRLIRLGLAERIVFIGPALKLRHRSTFQPEIGVHVVTPHLVLPRLRGGVELLAHEIRARFLGGIDVLWINDALVGVHCLDRGLPAVYDVTDDWRSARMTSHDRARLISAEDALAGSARTTVCSDVLRDRWFERYGIDSPVIHNGVDVNAHAAAQAIELPGRRPHVVYVGTLHHERLDCDLLVRMVQEDAAGTVHLVGPDHLDNASRRLLQGTGRVMLHGPVSHSAVPNWMASADVLVSPHRVDDFTLSLDAIKSFEYLASGRPIVATPTSGFQTLDACEGLDVIASEAFVEIVAVRGRDRMPTIPGRGRDLDWSARTREFAEQLALAGGSRG